MTHGISRFGKTMCEAWGHLVDAVMAGEDTFACPDQYTYDWVMGQFPRLCFPVLTELITYSWDRENSVSNGIAGFTYLVPREEASERIADFAQQIEQILNDTLEEDYSDFEKAIALYDYFFRTYQYDWETYEKKTESMWTIQRPCAFSEQDRGFAARSRRRIPIC